MHWYKPLYVGEIAGKKRFSILQKLRFHKPHIGAYVITPAINGKNLLEIYPSSVFIMPYYRKQDLLVVGIAWGYTEALEVVRQIIDDTYVETGGFDVTAYLEEKTRM